MCVCVFVRANREQRKCACVRLSMRIEIGESVRLLRFESVES